MYKKLLLSLIEKRAAHPNKRQMEVSSIVFSPHYDDETLGVGGTILKKRKYGANVYIVFMTDGSRSHAHAMDKSRLSELRRNEALNAAKVLGVNESHVKFLNFPETNLQQHTEEAVKRVTDLLLEIRCQQVFVPSSFEPLLWSADHKATTDIVFRSLIHSKQQPDILEYGVWFWYHWPWIPILRSNDTRQLLKLSMKSLFGLAALLHFNTAIRITDVLYEKRCALEKYNSQMTRLDHNKPWPVLGDIAQGEFLNLFFGSTEFFNCYPYPGDLNLQERAKELWQ